MGCVWMESKARMLLWGLQRSLAGQAEEESTGSAIKPRRAGQPPGAFICKAAHINAS
jgi:hypothetical protein